MSRVFKLVFSLSIAITLVSRSKECTAQELKELSANYEIKLERNQTIAEAEKICLESARIKAIGQLSMVVSSRTTSLVNEENGVVQSRFNSSDVTQVLGTWLYDKTEPHLSWRSEGDGGDFFVTARVHGMVKPISSEGETELIVKVLKRENEKSEPMESDAFTENELISFSTVAAEDGLVHIFYLDNFLDSASLLVPGYAMNEIKANKEIEFLQGMFSSSVSDTVSGVSNDEILVVFSRTPLKSPLLKESGGLPRLSIRDLNKWLDRNLNGRDDISVVRKSITITNR
jgi:hypothetical protein